MNVTQRQFVWGIVWAVLLLLVACGYWSMRHTKERLSAVRAQEQECARMAKEISQLQDRPGFAALNVDSPRTITTRAEAAGQQAALPAAALVRIEPQAALQLRDSPYRLRPTRLELRGVTLEQVVKFTHAMIDESQGTTVRDLRLTIAGNQATKEEAVDLWTAELVLTQLIFSPLRR